MKQYLKSYAVITLGSVIYALSFDWFVAPNQFAMGGVTGLAQILHHWFPALTVGAASALMNVPLFLIGWKKIGGHLLVSSLYAMVVSSAAIDGLNLLFDFQPMDPILAALFGGGVMGVGLGLVFAQGATTGGTDIVAKLLKLKWPWLPIGKLVVVPDTAVMLLVALTFGQLSAMLYGFIKLYTCSKAMLTGLQDEMICSGRLDDLSMVHAGMTALLAACDKPSKHTRVLAIFDNEETGSGTKQGAGSPILEHILRRIVMTRGGGEAQYMRAVAGSFMISADNAHGLHPNYVSKYDPTNHPVLGGGPCIKVNANCKYMTDADSAAAFRAVCDRAGVPCQSFVNHSDVAGGSTLGNILTSQIPLRGVDMGAPVWAMHSACETASTADHIYTIKAFTEFYSLY